jgi:small subunit ribosomal protein S7
MEDVLTAVEQKTKENPIKVLVTAIENAAPREEITTIEYGGARYPKAVECSPQRRIDMALRLMTSGSAQKAFGSGKGIVQALVEEIVAAYNCSNQSVAIAKKFELERQADSSR